MLHIGKTSKLCLNHTCHIRLIDDGLADKVMCLKQKIAAAHPIDVKHFKALLFLKDLYDKLTPCNGQRRNRGGGGRVGKRCGSGRDGEEEAGEEEEEEVCFEFMFI